MEGSRLLSLRKLPGGVLPPARRLLTGRESLPGAHATPVLILGGLGPPALVCTISCHRVRAT